MPSRRLHVIKAPTNIDALFPYSHYADEGHNPLLSAANSNGNLVLTCEDLFKLKPNVQKRKLIRIDIYMPGRAALELGVDIVNIFGAGDIAELAVVNPEAFRAGRQTLPIIDERREILQLNSEVNIAGYRVVGGPGRIFLDRERPNEGHIEMQGPEVHIGIPMRSVNGQLDKSLINYIEVPEKELRVLGEKNPIPKARGLVQIVIAPQEARKLAATLIHYGQD